jgi:enterochelin esterase-like enzyme
MLEKTNRIHFLIWLVILFIFLLSACDNNEAMTENSGSKQDNNPTFPPPTLPAPLVTESTVEITPLPDVLSQDCEDQRGSVDTFLISRNDIELSGSIYTPPCYGEDPEQSYPALYLIHGATATDQQWIDLGITETADRLITSARIDPLIIVMPLEQTWIALPVNPFGDHVVTELIPWVDQNYLTKAGSEFRSIGGMSRGGNWAVRIGLLHWGLFGAIGAHSTPLFFGDLNRIQGWIEVIPDSRIPEIYLDIGQDDANRDDVEDFQQRLSDLEVPHEWVINPGLHNELYWSSQIENYLLWYSSSWEDHYN